MFVTVLFGYLVQLCRAGYFLRGFVGIVYCHRRTTSGHAIAVLLGDRKSDITFVHVFFLLSDVIVITCSVGESVDNSISLGRPNSLRTKAENLAILSDECYFDEKVYVEWQYWYFRLFLL